jgi:hypothetical protein
MYGKIINGLFFVKVKSKSNNRTIYGIKYLDLSTGKQVIYLRKWIRNKDDSICALAETIVDVVCRYFNSNNNEILKSKYIIDIFSRKHKEPDIFEVDSIRDLKKDFNKLFTYLSKKHNISSESIFISSSFYKNNFERKNSAVKPLIPHYAESIIRLINEFDIGADVNDLTNMVRVCPEIIKYMPNDYFTLDIYTNLLYDNKNSYFNMPYEVKKDKSFAIQLMKYFPDIRLLSEELHSDKDVVYQAAIRKSINYGRYLLSDGVVFDFDFLYRLVRYNKFVWQDVEENIRLRFNDDPKEFIRTYDLMKKLNKELLVNPIIEKKKVIKI